MNFNLADMKIRGTWFLLSTVILVAPSLAAPRNIGEFPSSSLVTSPAMVQHAAPAATPHSTPHSTPAATKRSAPSPTPHSAPHGAVHSTPGTVQHPSAKPTTSKPSGARANSTQPTAQAPSPHRGGSTQTSSTTGSRTSSESHGARQTVEKRSDGSTKVTRSTGASIVYGKDKKIREVTTRSGAVAKVGPSGRISVIQAKGIRINYGPHGRTQIETVRADRSRVVSVGRHYGFVEHPFTRNGHAYISRTYVVNGHVYAHVYSQYYYHGASFYRYMPAYYYGPRFYGWAYYPWTAPVYWGWGWYGAPWYAYYGYYFAPAPYYLDSSLWLTDYLLAQSLQAAYDARISDAAQAQGTSQSAASSAPISDEMKQAIAEEVKAQLAAERDVASGSQQTMNTAEPVGSQEEQLPDALDPRQRTFLVFTSLDEQTGGGAECTLTPGDVLTRIDDTADANQDVKVLVSSSKRKDCRPGSQVRVAVQDLQEMHNQFREQIDQGLEKLALNQGAKGLPSAPDANPRASANGQAVPDLTASDELQRQLQQVRSVESEVQQAAKQSS